MTDVELKRLQAICEVANVDDIEDVSDGFHTFNDLYEQRMYLFAALVNAYKDKAWKSLRHEDGEPCFGGDWFIVGIDTPKGSYTYHYGIQYWDVFDCEVLPRAKHWDGHTDKDVIRLISLRPDQKMGKWLSHYEYCEKHGYTPVGSIVFWWCDQCGQGVEHPTNFCPNCGAYMRGDGNDRT